MVYRALHLGAVRLERHRMAQHDSIADSYDQMRDVLTRL